VKAGEYHLFLWGGIENDGLATAKFGPERNYWFATPEERAIFRANVSLFAKAAGQIVCFSENDGPTALKRTIAKMSLMYKSAGYAFEYDFGYGYPERAAKYSFFEGNNSCDCSLSTHLRCAHPEVDVPELDCGDEIEIEDFEIEYRD
jgi:hypothetical protein